jgi:hypothetical protein
MGEVFFNKSSVFDRLNSDFGCLPVASASMKIASSTIRDLRAFVRQRVPLPGINGGDERLSFF